MLPIQKLPLRLDRDYTRCSTDCFIGILRYCEGVMPVCFLNISLKVDKELKPASYAIEAILWSALLGSASKCLASSTR
jgi:hypothetical protein